MAQNPYAAPSAAVADVAPEGDFELADRGSRLGAAIVDGLLALPVFGLAVMARMSGNTMSPGIALIIMVYCLVLLVVDLVLLHRNAQTIGKKVLGIKIARKDGSQATLGRIFWLRGVVNALPSFIPFIGYFYGLIDVLFIFGEPRRCIHDYIADTVVIKA